MADVVCFDAGFIAAVWNNDLKVNSTSFTLKQIHRTGSTFGKDQLNFI